MDAALLFLGLLWALFGGRRRVELGPAVIEPEPLEPAPLQPHGPGFPGSPISTSVPAPPPWPQVVPSGLPKFPGAGWEFDEPPPPAVQQRAQQLLAKLWARGNKAWLVEKTAGRWIVYQAQIVASGKKGVVAYRERKALPAPRPPAAPAPRPPAAPAPRPPAAPAPAPPEQPAGLVLPTLRVGAGMPPAAPNSDVRLLQERLGIPADGRFGRGTHAAVVKFQGNNGLAVDGVVGRATWTRLFDARERA